MSRPVLPPAGTSDGSIARSRFRSVTNACGPITFMAATATRTMIPRACSVQRVRRASSRPAVTASATASHAMATSTTRRSSVHPYIDW